MPGFQARASASGPLRGPQARWRGALPRKLERSRDRRPAPRFLSNYDNNADLDMRWLRKLPPLGSGAPPAESLPAPKNFFAKASFTQRLPPLWDRTIFRQVFVRGGMIKFSKWKVPPTGGQARCDLGQARCDKLLVARLCSLLRPSRGHCSLL